MRFEEVNIIDLLPVADACLREDLVQNKMQLIKEGRKVLILGIPSDYLPGKFYVLDGHHSALAYQRLNRKPVVKILETSEDLSKEAICRYRNYYDITIFKGVLHRFYLRAKMKGIYTPQDFEKHIR